MATRGSRPLGISTNMDDSNVIKTSNNQLYLSPSLNIPRFTTEYENNFSQSLYSQIKKKCQM